MENNVRKLCRKISRQLRIARAYQSIAKNLNKRAEKHIKNSRNILGEIGAQIK